MRGLLKFTTLLTLAITAHAENFNVIPKQDRTMAALVSDTSRPSALGTESDRRAYRAWKISVLPVLASQAFDTASSYGMLERNPLLADANGRFGAKATGIKIGATAAILGVEYLVVRNHPNAARLLAKLNWTGAIVTSSFAVHNYAIR